MAKERAKIASVFYFAALSCGAQTPADLTFEVASVKVAQGAAAFDVSPAGGFRVSGWTLKELMVLAYDIRESELSGKIPGWVTSERYAIVAKPPDGPLLDQKQNIEQTQIRLQSLLRDRFHLGVHREPKEIQVYELVISKSGLKLHESTAAESDFKLKLGKGKILAKRVKLAALARLLSNDLERPAIDSTGLESFYDFQLDYATDDGKSGAGPSIFSAVQDQLGLKLESRKRTQNVLVFDQADKPAEN